MKVWAKTTLIICIVIAAIILISGCISPGCILGSGNLTTENRTVEKFSSIEIQGMGDLYLSQGQQLPLRIEAEDNILRVLKADVNGEKLTIYTTACIAPNKPIKIYASASEISGLYVSGSGNIVGLSKISSDALDLGVSGSGKMNIDVDCKDLHTDISGSGSAVLQGKAANSSVNISGSGTIASYDLTTNVTRINISGAGLAEVNVQSELNAQISGSGGVYYKGHPTQINQQVTGSGSVTNVG